MDPKNVFIQQALFCQGSLTFNEETAATWDLSKIEEVKVEFKCEVIPMPV